MVPMSLIKRLLRTKFSLTSGDTLVFLVPDIVKMRRSQRTVSAAAVVTMTTSACTATSVSATSCAATSGNATSCAATSGNATSCAATSVGATSAATLCGHASVNAISVATSCRATSVDAISTSTFVNAISAATSCAATSVNATTVTTSACATSSLTSATTSSAAATFASISNTTSAPVTSHSISTPLSGAVSISNISTDGTIATTTTTSSPGNTSTLAQRTTSDIAASSTSIATTLAPDTATTDSLKTEWSISTTCKLYQGSDATVVNGEATMNCVSKESHNKATTPTLVPSTAASTLPILRTSNATVSVNRSSLDEKKSTLNQQSLLGSFDESKINVPSDDCVPSFSAGAPKVVVNQPNVNGKSLLMNSNFSGSQPSSDFKMGNPAAASVVDEVRSKFSGSQPSSDFKMGNPAAASVVNEVRSKFFGSQPSSDFKIGNLAAASVVDEVRSAANKKVVESHEVSPRDEDSEGASLYPGLLLLDSETVRDVAYLQDWDESTPVTIFFKIVHHTSRRLCHRDAVVMNKEDLLSIPSSLVSEVRNSVQFEPKPMPVIQTEPEEASDHKMSTAPQENNDIEMKECLNLTSSSTNIEKPFSDSKICTNKIHVPSSAVSILPKPEEQQPASTDDALHKWRVVQSQQLQKHEKSEPVTSKAKGATILPFGVPFAQPGGGLFCLGASNDIVTSDPSLPPLTIVPVSSDSGGSFEPVSTVSKNPPSSSAMTLEDCLNIAGVTSVISPTASTPEYDSSCSTASSVATSNPGPNISSSGAVLTLDFAAPGLPSNGSCNSHSVHGSPEFSLSASGFKSISTDPQAGKVAAPNGGDRVDVGASSTATNSSLTEPPDWKEVQLKISETGIMSVSAGDDQNNVMESLLNQVESESSQRLLSSIETEPGTSSNTVEISVLPTSAANKAPCEVSSSMSMIKPDTSEVSPKLSIQSSVDSNQSCISCDDPQPVSTIAVSTSASPIVALTMPCKTESTKAITSSVKSSEFLHSLTHSKLANTESILESSQKLISSPSDRSCIKNSKSDEMLVDKLIDTPHKELPGKTPDFLSPVKYVNISDGSACATKDDLSDDELPPLRVCENFKRKNTDECSDGYAKKPKVETSNSTSVVCALPFSSPADSNEERPVLNRKTSKLKEIAEKQRSLFNKSSENLKKDARFVDKNGIPIDVKSRHVPLDVAAATITANLKNLSKLSTNAPLSPTVGPGSRKVEVKTDCERPGRKSHSTGYKTLNTSPKGWNPTISKEQFQLGVSNAGLSPKTNKFFKARNAPRILSPSSLGVLKTCVPHPVVDATSSATPVKPKCKKTVSSKLLAENNIKPESGASILVNDQALKKNDISFAQLGASSPKLTTCSSIVGTLIAPSESSVTSLRRGSTSITPKHSKVLAQGSSEPSSSTASLCTTSKSTVQPLKPSGSFSPKTPLASSAPATLTITSSLQTSALSMKPLVVTSTFSHSITPPETLQHSKKCPRSSSKSANSPSLEETNSSQSSKPSEVLKLQSASGASTSKRSEPPTSETKPRSGINHVESDNNPILNESSTLSVPLPPSKINKAVADSGPIARCLRSFHKKLEAAKQMEKSSLGIKSESDVGNFNNKNSMINVGRNCKTDVDLPNASIDIPSKALKTSASHVSPHKTSTGKVCSTDDSVAEAGSKPPLSAGNQCASSIVASESDKSQVMVPLPCDNDDNIGNENVKPAASSRSVTVLAVGSASKSNSSVVSASSVADISPTTPSVVSALSVDNTSTSTTSVVNALSVANTSTSTTSVDSALSVDNTSPTNSSVVSDSSVTNTPTSTSSVASALSVANTSTSTSGVVSALSVVDTSTSTSGVVSALSVVNTSTSTSSLVSASITSKHLVKNVAPVVELSSNKINFSRNGNDSISSTLSTDPTISTVTSLSVKSLHPAAPSNSLGTISVMPVESSVLTSSVVAQKEVPEFGENVSDISSCSIEKSKALHESVNTLFNISKLDKSSVPNPVQLPSATTNDTGRKLSNICMPEPDTDQVNVKSRASCSSPSKINRNANRPAVSDKDVSSTPQPNFGSSENSFSSLLLTDKVSSEQCQTKSVSVESNTNIIEESKIGPSDSVNKIQANLGSKSVQESKKSCVAPSSSSSASSQSTHLMVPSVPLVPNRGFAHQNINIGNFKPKDSKENAVANTTITSSSRKTETLTTTGLMSSNVAQKASSMSENRIGTLVTVEKSKVPLPKVSANFNEHKSVSSSQLTIEACSSVASTDKPAENASTRTDTPNTTQTNDNPFSHINSNYYMPYSFYPSGLSSQMNSSYPYFGSSFPYYNQSLTNNSDDNSSCAPNSTSDENTSCRVTDRRQASPWSSANYGNLYGSSNQVKVTNSSSLIPSHSSPNQNFPPVTSLNTSPNFQDSTTLTSSTTSSAMLETSNTACLAKNKNLNAAVTSRVPSNTSSSCLHETNSSATINFSACSLKSSVVSSALSSPPKASLPLVYSPNIPSAQTLGLSSSSGLTSISNNSPATRSSTGVDSSLAHVRSTKLDRTHEHYKSSSPYSSDSAEGLASGGSGSAKENSKRTMKPNSGSIAKKPANASSSKSTACNTSSLDPHSQMLQNYPMLNSSSYALSNFMSQNAFQQTTPNFFDPFSAYGLSRSIGSSSSQTSGASLGNNYADFHNTSNRASDVSNYDYTGGCSTPKTCSDTRVTPQYHSYNSAGYFNSSASSPNHHDSSNTMNAMALNAYLSNINNSHSYPGYAMTNFPYFMSNSFSMNMMQSSWNSLQLAKGSGSMSNSLDSSQYGNSSANSYPSFYYNQNMGYPSGSFMGNAGSYNNYPYFSMSHLSHLSGGTQSTPKTTQASPSHNLHTTPSNSASLKMNVKSSTPGNVKSTSSPVQTSISSDLRSNSITKQKRPPNITATESHSTPVGSYELHTQCSSATPLSSSLLSTKSRPTDISQSSVPAHGQLKAQSSSCKASDIQTVTDVLSSLASLAPSIDAKNVFLECNSRISSVSPATLSVQTKQDDPSEISPPMAVPVSRSGSSSKRIGKTESVAKVSENKCGSVTDSPRKSDTSRGDDTKSLTSDMTSAREEFRKSLDSEKTSIEVSGASLNTHCASLKNAIKDCESRQTSRKNSFGDDRNDKVVDGSSSVSNSQLASEPTSASCSKST
ncbi:serine-rich adhesin for platelets [Hyalella azteca]|uniref:Serine-rich adhesin for platelets n=1 Tax=Hyalella azteca TaxID=294128 RepID=A0A979FIG3_HYAAZ|nr:serine-rich adhesin for platelets [Hyalella azteca]